MTRQTKKATSETKRTKRTKKTEGRIFANPQNSDEAGLVLPPFREQLGINKTEREILETGTLRQKVRLYYTLMDFGGYFGAPKGEVTLTDVMNNIHADVKPFGEWEPQAKKFIKKSSEEFEALRKYGSQMGYYFKIFQTSFAVLATILNKLSIAEKMAETSTAYYRALYGSRIVTEKDSSPLFEKEEIDERIDDFIIHETTDKFTIAFDEKAIALRVVLPPKTKEEIEAAAKDTIETLSDFKAFVVAVEKFIKKSSLKYTPIAIRTTTLNAREERYTRYLVSDRSFFRSELNCRRERGETITEAEERRAVIPDFEEMEPSKDILEYCENTLYSYMHNPDKAE